MIIVITAQGKTPEDKVDARFGRAAYFIRYDMETGEWQCMDNRQQLDALQGAGLQAAKHVAEMNADVLITGFVGPKAYSALKLSGTKMVNHKKESTVKEAIEQFKQGLLSEIVEANVEGHWV